MAISAALPLEAAHLVSHSCLQSRAPPTLSAPSYQIWHIIEQRMAEILMIQQEVPARYGAILYPLVVRDE